MLEVKVTMTSPFENYYEASTYLSRIDNAFGKPLDFYNSVYLLELYCVYLHNRISLFSYVHIVFSTNLESHKYDKRFRYY